MNEARYRMYVDFRRNIVRKTHSSRTTPTTMVSNNNDSLRSTDSPVAGDIEVPNSLAGGPVVHLHLHISTRRLSSCP